jgi:hypothetical protein
VEAFLDIGTQWSFSSAVFITAVDSTVNRFTRMVLLKLEIILKAFLIYLITV